MKTARITGLRQADLTDISEPQLRTGWALVKIHAAPMCTEYKAFLNGTPVSCLGHEAAGEVVNVSQCSHVKPGDRVVVMPTYPDGQCPLCLSGNYIHCESMEAFNAPTYAQYIAKPEFLLPAIPDGISYEMASLACCGLGASFGALEKLSVDAFTTVLISGLGPVGLGAVVNAKYRGARVIGVEMNEYRASLARKLGTSEVISPADPMAADKIRSLTGGTGPDCGIDCSGNPAAHRLLIDSVRRLGKIAFVGECSDDTVIHVSPDLIRKGLSLMGSWHYNLNDFPKLMQVISQSRAAHQLITHTFALDQIQTALELAASQQCGKIILKPWADQD